MNVDFRLWILIFFRFLSVKRAYLSLVLYILVIFFPQNVYSAGQNIKIGLLIADDQYTEAKNGAKMAIQLANEEGGIDGRKVQLITRSMAGPWGIGSKEAVNLIFNENVWAILGSHDGRNAHLVEQVIAKTQTVFISSWTGDPTLSQAFVPWYFSCVPNNLQQAVILAEEIYDNKSNH